MAEIVEEIEKQLKERDRNLNIEEQLKIIREIGRRLEEESKKLGFSSYFKFKLNRGDYGI